MDEYQAGAFGQWGRPRFAVRVMLNSATLSTRPCHEDRVEFDTVEVGVIDADLNRVAQASHSLEKGNAAHLSPSTGEPAMQHAAAGIGEGAGG